MSGTGLAVRNGGNAPSKLDDKLAQKKNIEKGTGRIPKKGGYYSVGSVKNPKFEADAWRVQEEANESRISTVIVKTTQTKDYAETIVRAIHPDGHYAEGIVHHDFNTIMNKKLMEMLKKQIAEDNIFFGPSGKRKKIEVFADLQEPYITNDRGESVPNLTPLGNVKILDDMFQFKDISIRDATTKAMRIAQLKITNEDWRDNAEIKAEIDEVQSINNSKQVPRVNQDVVDAKTTKKEVKKAPKEEMKREPTDDKAETPKMQEFKGQGKPVKAENVPKIFKLSKDLEEKFGPVWDAGEDIPNMQLRKEAHALLEDETLDDKRFKEIMELSK